MLAVSRRRSAITPATFAGCTKYGIPRFPRLPGVHPVAEIVGPLDEVGVCGRLVRPDSADELLDLKHSCSEPGGSCDLPR